jgi:hypothetical protein
MDHRMGLSTGIKTQVGRCGRVRNTVLMAEGILVVGNTALMAEGIRSPCKVLSCPEQLRRGPLSRSVMIQVASQSSGQSRSLVLVHSFTFTITSRGTGKVPTHDGTKTVGDPGGDGSHMPSSGMNGG